MNAQRLIQVSTLLRRSLPAVFLTASLAVLTGCSSSQHADLANCLRTLRASHNNAEAIGSLDPSATVMPGDRSRNATDDGARPVSTSVSRHPIR